MSKELGLDQDQDGSDDDYDDTDSEDQADTQAGEEVRIS